MAPRENDIAVDGYTWAELRDMCFDGVVRARCVFCNDEWEVEPDARNYDCHSCGAKQSISSPLVKLGLI